jgi:hypothetical protein
MKRPARKSMVIGAVIFLDAALVLFPDWVAVRATDPTLTTYVGHAWLTSPPASPEPSSATIVHRGTYWIWAIGFVSVLGVIAYVAAM